MSSYVSGYRSPNDPQYKKMLKVKHACEEAGLDLPKEVEDYFPDEEDDSPLKVEIPCEKSQDDASDIFTVFVKDIPKGVERITFRNSY